MARKYDLIERLKAKNERPFLVLDEEHAYSINTSKTNVMAIMAIMDSKQHDGQLNDMSIIDDVIRMSLGKEALEFINGLGLSIAATQEIIKSIMAAMADISIDEADKKEAKSSKKK